MPYLPSADTIFASTSPTSQRVFTEFLPFAYLALGFIVGALIVAFLIWEFPGLIIRTIHGDRKPWHDSI